MTSTCQICARPIKSSKRVIAYHGYKRPGNGWQTSSCMGAKHLPYEVSCDALPLAIESITRYIDNQIKIVEDLMTNPSAELTHITCDNTKIVAFRPDDFDAEKEFKRGSHRPKLYGAVFSAKVRYAQGQAKMAKENQKFLEERLAMWKGPAS